MKYQCCNCDSIFDSDEAIRATDFEGSEFWGFVGVEPVTYLACPTCGSGEIQEHIDDGDDDE